MGKFEKSTVGFMCFLSPSKQIKHHSTEANSFKHLKRIIILETLNNTVV